MSRALLLLRQSQAGAALHLPQATCHNSIRPLTISRHASNSSSSSSSVSPTEVSHFQSLASSWWDPRGPSRLLHLMNPMRHEFIQSLTSKKASTYLDIGCGGGIFASSAARLPTTSSVTAIDPTPSVIAVAREHQRTDPLLSQPGKLTYLNCAVEELHSHLPALSNSDANDQQFDVITLFEVIEHIARPSQFLSYTLQKHLKPGGWLIGSTIARHPLSYFTTKVIGEAPWPVGLVPPGTHDWDQYVNPGELRDWTARQNALAAKSADGDVYGDVAIRGCMYVPFLGWKWVGGSEEYGNYFFGLQKLR